MKPLKELIRPNIWELKPYSSARDEYQGKEASVFLDANENPYNIPNNRYPDPLQRDLKHLIAKEKKVQPEQIFLGNGSDEAIDLPFRAFCRPGWTMWWPSSRLMACTRYVPMSTTWPTGRCCSTTTSSLVPVNCWLPPMKIPN